MRFLCILLKIRWKIASKLEEYMYLEKSDFEILIFTQTVTIFFPHLQCISLVNVYWDCASILKSLTRGKVFLRKGFLINTIALSVLLVLFPDHLQSVFSFLMHVVAVFRSHQSISCYGKGLSIVIAFSLIFQNKWFSTYKCVLYIFIFVKIFIKIHSKYFQCKKLCFFFKWDGILKWKLWSDLFLHIMGEFKGFSQRKSYLCS